MSNDLIFDDWYVSATSNRIAFRSRELDKIMTRYKDILQTMKDEAITDGKISVALEQYISTVSSVLGTLKEMGENLVTITDGFKEEIDNTDGDLY